VYAAFWDLGAGPTASRYPVVFAVAVPLQLGTAIPPSVTEEHFVFLFGL